MLTKWLPHLITRVLLWSIALPIVGTLIVMLTPILGLFLILLLLTAPIKLLLFVYFSGFVPSLIVSSAFFSLVTRRNLLFTCAATCLLAALASTCWSYVAEWWFASPPTYSSGYRYYLAGVAATASLTLPLSLKFDQSLVKLIADRRKSRS